ncbi:MAG: hypothetical protein HFH24_03305 [Ruminococcus sp.]|nr:hypothetical protein [Ruminococcus sp.]
MNAVKRFICSLKDPDVFFTFLNYIVKIFLNPVIVVFIPIFLQEDVQGYWYTFGSIAALTNYADLGFTAIMTQYVAHECAFLTYDKGKKIFLGSSERIERLASLFRFVIRWVGMILAIASGVIFTIGFVMFSGYTEGVSWKIQWALYVGSTILNFAAEIELAFFEGCNQFAITQKIRTVAGGIYCIVTILLLAAGMGLYALGIPLLVKAGIVYVMLNRKFQKALRQLRTCPLTVEVRWIDEFLPLLGRYAVSWISGYFITQIYNPLTFARFGSIAAGKVGYCLSIIQAVYSVANVWIVLATPRMNMLEEKKDWAGMDRTLKRNLSYSAVTYGMGIMAVFVLGNIPVLESILWMRMLSKTAVLILSTAYLGSMVINALAVYLRAHKREPFMVLSVCSGVISSCITVLLAYTAEIDFIFLGMLLDYVVIVPYGVYLWRKYRRLWHGAKEKI